MRVYYNGRWLVKAGGAAPSGVRRVKIAFEIGTCATVTELLGRRRGRAGIRNAGLSIEWERELDGNQTQDGWWNGLGVFYLAKTSAQQ